MSCTQSHGRAKKKSIGALLAAVIVVGTIGVVAGPAAAAPITLAANSSINPGSVTAGGSANDTITIFNENPSTAHHVFLEVFVNQGTFDLVGTKASNPGVSCKLQPVSSFSARFGAASSLDSMHLGCNVGDIPPGSFDVHVIISTAGIVTNESTTVFADVNVTSSDPGSCGVEACQGTSLEVFAGSNTGVGASTSTFVPPGGTAFVGPQTPDAETPTVGSFKLPKKELILPPPPPPFAAASSSNKPQPGPGASITLTLLDPSAEPTACGGQQCRGLLVSLSDFAGYNDPKHPPLFTLSVFANLDPNNPIDPAAGVYLIKGGIGVALDKCTKSQGAFANLPCIQKHKFKKGIIMDTIALLSGDPIGGHR